MIETSDYDTTRGQLTAFLANRAPDLSTSPVEFPGELVGALAQLAQGLQETAGRASADAVPSSETSTEGLDAIAVAFGLDNGAGGYGRRGATAAAGLTATLSGAQGITYQVGQVAVSGGVRFLLTIAVTLPGTFGDPGTTQAPGIFNADGADPGSLGPAGNLTRGALLQLVSPPPGSDSSATVTAEPTTPGVAAEEDSALLARILAKTQRPPNGGTGPDYQDWAEKNQTQAGVRISAANLQGYIYPNYYGTLLPLVVLTQSGSGRGRVPTSDVVDATALAINGIPGTPGTPGRRPVGQDASVLPAYAPASRAVRVIFRYVPASADYAPDWSRQGRSFTAQAFSIANLPQWARNAGANAVLTLGQVAPTNLKTAVQAGRRPRLFGDWISGSTLLGPAIPELAPVVAFQDAAGVTALGLVVSSPATWATWVQAGNLIYPGGPIFPRVPQSVIDACDSLGPSRVSGLADPAQLWQDTLGITSVSTAAANTLDEDGVTRMIDRAIGNSVLLGIGGTLASDDLQAQDNGADGPEILTIGRVVAAD